MSIRSTRKGPLTPEEELEVMKFAEELNKKFKNMSPTVLSNEVLNSDDYAPPKRSYWPYIQAALDKGDKEFNRVVDSIFAGTFEFPPETAEEYEARMKRRVKVCNKW